MNRSTVSLLLAGTALITVGALYPQSGAANETPLVVAQAQPDADRDRGRGGARERQQQQTPNAQPRGQQDRQATPPQQNRNQPPAAQAPQQQQQQRSAQPSDMAPSRTQSAQQPGGQQQQPGAGRERDDRRQTGQQAPTLQQDRQQPRTTQQPGQQQPPAAQQMDQRRQQPAQTQPSEQDRRQQPAQTQPAERDRRQQPAQTQPTEQDRRQQPAQTQQDRQQDRRPADTATSPQQQRPGQAQQDARPRDAGEFIRRGDSGPSRRIDDLRRERREERVGNQTVIREGDRTIVRDGNRTVIRHDENLRFTIGARGVQVQQVGGERRTVVTRPDGSRIVTVVDNNGRLVRRIRQVNGRDFVIIDNRLRMRPGYQMFVMLPPPVIRIPRERYIVDYRVGMPAPVIYETLAAEPVEPISERYTLEQVRFSEPLRARMPRVDLDITFETGSWQLTPDQVAKLEVIADGIKRATERNPQEVFLIEGHTDAVGNDEDNLSLSDRRAEAVAVALSEQFQVPPENLTTQGYGEQNLKVQTEGPSEENRRVSVRRVTPLLAQEGATTGGGGGQPQ